MDSTIPNLMIGVLINLGIPFLGFIVFIILCRKINNENDITVLTIELFFLFMTYIGLIILILTEFFWVWSGMASLGVFYLFLIAPIAMSIIAVKHWNKRNLTIYHKAIVLASLSYFLVGPVTFYLLITYKK